MSLTKIRNELAALLQTELGLDDWEIICSPDRDSILFQKSNQIISITARQRSSDVEYPRKVGVRVVFRAVEDLLRAGERIGEGLSDQTIYKGFFEEYSRRIKNLQCRHGTISSVAKLKGVEEIIPYVGDVVHNYALPFLEKFDSMHAVEDALQGGIQKDDPDHFWIAAPYTLGRRLIIKWLTCSEDREEYAQQLLTERKAAEKEAQVEDGIIPQKYGRIPEIYDALKSLTDEEFEILTDPNYETGTLKFGVDSAERQKPLALGQFEMAGFVTSTAFERQSQIRDLFPKLSVGNTKYRVELEEACMRERGPEEEGFDFFTMQGGTFIVTSLDPIAFLDFAAASVDAGPIIAFRAMDRSDTYSIEMFKDGRSVGKRVDSGGQTMFAAGEFEGIPGDLNGYLIFDLIRQHLGIDPFLEPVSFAGWHAYPQKQVVKRKKKKKKKKKKKRKKRKS